MSVCKIFLFVFLQILCSTLVLAQSREQVRQSSVNLGTYSWTEILSAPSLQGSSRSTASFFGNVISYQRDFYKGRKGESFEVGAVVGKVTYGATDFSMETGIPIESLSFFAGYASYKLIHRLSRPVHIAAGPQLLYRQHEARKNTSELERGPEFNVGLVGEVKLKLNDQIEFKTTVGTLAIRAQTLFGLHLGLQF